MNAHVYRIVSALVLGLALTAAFIANLARANEVSGAGHVYCVVPTSTTPGPFAACDQVFQSVQTAVSTAVNQDEIWVAAGHYTDVHTTTNGNWSQVLFITKSLTIRGGYLPPFTNPPDPLANPTILDAQSQATTVLLLTPQTTLTGLHITGGSPFGVEVQYGEAVTFTHNTIYSNGGGAGLFIAHSTAVFNQNTVRDNLGGGTGGGLAVWDSQVSLDNNDIIGNVALSQTLNPNDEAYGGGLWAEDSVITLTNNAILSNTAVLSATSGSFNSPSGFGGGLAFINSQVFASNNEIGHNTAIRAGPKGLGGGLYSHNSSRLHLVGNRLFNNVALAACGHCDVGFGGGLYVAEYASAVTPTIILAHNLIQENIAGVRGIEGSGGGLYFLGNSDQPTPLTLHHNTFISNTGLVSGSIGLGGGLLLLDVQANLSNNEIFSNTAAISAQSASFAGGLFMRGGQASLNGDRIINNTAVSSDFAYGGGIGFIKGDLILTNTVLLNNRANAGAALIAYSGPGRLSLNHTTIANNQGNSGSALFLKDEPNAISQGPFLLTMTNTILVSHTIGISVTGSHTVTAAGLLWYNTPTPTLAGPTAHLSLTHELVGDPRFAPDGYHLSAGSAAIRTGVPAAVALDIDGEGRPFFPSLGVDEYWPYKSYLALIRH